MAPEYFEKQEPCLEAGQCPSVHLYLSSYLPELHTSSLFLWRSVDGVQGWNLFLMCLCCVTACNDMDRWPAPHPGRILTLPIMGVVIKVRAPSVSLMLVCQFERQDLPS